MFVPGAAPLGVALVGPLPVVGDGPSVLGEPVELSDSGDGSGYALRRSLIAAAGARLVALDADGVAWCVLTGTRRHLLRVSLAQLWRVYPCLSDLCVAVGAGHCRPLDAVDVRRTGARPL